MSDNSEKTEINEEEKYREKVREQIEKENKQRTIETLPKYEQKIIRVEGNKTKELNYYLSNGWTIKSQTTISQGYSGSKTACLGCLFLPLALLGKKPDIIEYVLEKHN